MSENEKSTDPGLSAAARKELRGRDENVRFSTRIRNAVTAVGWKTVGEIREASDATLLGLQDLGPGSVTSLRETLGLPSCDGVRPLGKEPA